MDDKLTYHVGRSWDGPGPLEEGCPCPKEPCGLVRGDSASPECNQHHWGSMKTMRVGHRAESCMGPNHFACPGCGNPLNEGEHGSGGEYGGCV